MVSVNGVGWSGLQLFLLVTFCGSIEGAADVLVVPLGTQVLVLSVSCMVSVNNGGVQCWLVYSCFSWPPSVVASMEPPMCLVYHC